MIKNTTIIQSLALFRDAADFVATVPIVAIVATMMIMVVMVVMATMADRGAEGGRPVMVRSRIRRWCSPLSPRR